MNRYIELARDLEEIKRIRFMYIYFGGVIGFIIGLSFALAIMLL